ncbi:MAG: hypothetical protein AAF242_02730 [Bacteroidota bacterium]
MKRYWILIIGIVIAGAGLGLYFYNRSSDNLSVDPQIGIQGCIKVPNSFIAFTGDFSRVDYDGKYAGSIEKHISIRQDDHQQRSLVEAFFKEINVEPRSQYVKYFKKDIKKYLKAGPGLPHWDVNIGTLRCT